MEKASEYRRRARVDLGGGLFENKWLLAAVVALICGAILGCANFFSIILVGPISVAMSRIFYDLATKKKQPEIVRIFTAFTGDFVEDMLLGIMNTVLVFLWTLLLIVPGIVKYYSYSMCFYIKQRNPELKWRECLKESERLMNGKKWNLFCLDLSFIGWVLVAMCTFGIGTFFLTPYQKLAHANFFMDLVGEKKIGDFIEVEAEELK